MVTTQAFTQAFGKNLQGFPAPTQALHNLFIVHCCELGEQLFSKCDDTFYDLSQRASDIQERNLYFDSLRDLRVAHKGIINRFRQNLANTFLCAISGKPLPYTQESKSALSLVSDSDLEINLAISSMDKKAQQQYEQVFYTLKLRSKELFPEFNDSLHSSPLDPKNIALCFLHATQDQLKLSIKPTLIILKLFERHLLSQLNSTYTQINQILIQANILVQLPAYLSDNTKPARALPAHQAYVPNDTVNLSLPTTDTITLKLTDLVAIISQLKQLEQAPGLHISTYSNNPGSAMPQTELIHQLAYTQQQVAAAHNQQGAKNFLPTVINQLLSKKHPRQPQSLKSNDDNIINLIAVFFDFILDDTNISTAIKLQISRMQIPILRCALKDQGFFTNPKHPARCLIDTIAEVGITLDDGQELNKDSIYQHITRTTERLNSESINNSSVFDSALLDLKKLLKKEQRKALQIERRTAEAETGKHRLQLAKQAARKLLIDNLKHVRMPVGIRNFLISEWFKVLVFTHLKYQEGSQEWLQNEQTISDLIWASSPHIDRKGQLRLSQLKSDLTFRIRNAMDAIGEDAEQQQSIINKIIPILSKAEANQTSDIDYQELSTQQANSAVHKVSGEPLKTAISNQQETYAELTETYLNKAQSFNEGTWLIYQGFHGEQSPRCKLAKKINGDTFIFTNRFGFKLLQKSLREFAYDLQNQRVTTLDRRPLFERISQRLAQTTNAEAKKAFSNSGTH